MTSPECASGTDRVAEVARDLPEADILVNVQGDEPELPGSAIDLVVELLGNQWNALVADLRAASEVVVDTDYLTTLPEYVQ